MKSFFRPINPSLVTFCIFSMVLTGLLLLKLETGTNITTPVLAQGLTELPTGIVVPFDLEACPTGWTEYTNAQGRTVIGTNPTLIEAPNGIVSNAAISKTTSQSSTYVPTNPASAAVDGNRNTNYYGTGSVAMTNYEATPWWQVDLGSIQSIDTIQVFPRDDSGSISYLSDWYIFVSDVPFTSTTISTTIAQSGVSNYHKGQATNPTTQTVDRTGRYIRIQAANSTYLMLGEVEVNVENSIGIRTLGEVGGEEQHTLTLAEMPSHTHSFTNTMASTPGSGYVAYSAAYVYNYPNSGTAGSGQPHNNMAPFIALLYCKKN
jgi:hypothetical protein